MTRLGILGLILLLSCNIYGQIDMNDSTAQVVGFFNQNETQSYVVTEEKYKVKGADTTDREFVKYTVDITIVDSTADSYIIYWHYRDYDIASNNAIMKKIGSIEHDITVKILTDEYGALKEVINWEEVRDYGLKQIKLIKDEMKDIPNYKKLIKQIEGMYSTKESIESAAIQEIQQFYTFHGGKYKHGLEYVNDMQVANLLGGDPFDAKVTFWLDEINPDDDNIVMRLVQSTDSTQITEATFQYLVKMAETMKITPPTREELPMFTNDTFIASRIHGSGWPIYTVLTKITKAEGTTSVEERIIEIL